MHSSVRRCGTPCPLSSVFWHTKAQVPPCFPSQPQTTTLSYKLLSLLRSSPGILVGLRRQSYVPLLVFYQIVAADPPVSPSLRKVTKCLTTFVDRVHPEIAGMFADEMDILSLSRWRSTCRFNYRHASSSLRRTLTNRLRPFVPYPHHLVDMVTSSGAVFGGEVALAFLLRNEPYSPSCLEIYASNFQFDKLCASLLDDPDISRRIDKHTFLTNSVFHALRRLVAETLAIHLTNGLTIYVHQSYTCSSSAPITRATCTALSNFVTGHSFGCSHPKLTFSRRAMLADRELLYLTPHDALSVNRLLTSKFNLAVSPSAWDQHLEDFDGVPVESVERCRRTEFHCPNQGRFFGDKGSYVGYFDPLGKDEEFCMENNVAPFGPMVIWRLMSTFECDDGCEYLDEVLEPGATSVPVLFRKDPYGELQDCLSTQCMRHFPFHRSFTRRRSTSI